jgi:hypothetical protein
MSKQEFVQCKDCANIGILTVQATKYHDLPHPITILFSQSPNGKISTVLPHFRAPYCQRIDAITDLSALRRCGCFKLGDEPTELLTESRP